VIKKQDFINGHDKPKTQITPNQRFSFPKINYEFDLLI